MTFNSTLKPGKPMQRKTPMKATKPMGRGAWKKSAPKSHRMTAVEHRFLDACRGQTCYLRIPDVCLGGTETTVPAHSNQQRHGKGMGLKAADRYTIPACHACHMEIDQGNRFTREEKFALWDAAYVIWESVRSKEMMG